tara:strand:- start:31 stop:705 length:675 start_codon:yes stop_codon:yes gene_type:complete
MFAFIREHVSGEFGMARPAGVKNQDYEEKRLALLDAMIAYVEREDVVQPSLRQLAIASGVSDINLRHYFGDRRGVVIALFKHMRETSKDVRNVMRAPARTVSEAIESYVQLACSAGTDTPYIRRHVFALREAIADSEVYVRYVEEILDPAAAAVGKSLLESCDGAMTEAAAHQAGTHIVFNSMFLAMQRAMDPEDVDSKIFTTKLERFGRWIAAGLEAEVRKVA